MIKLPIVLTEHPDWRAAIHDAIATRASLAETAQKDLRYIRPIALFQAQDKGQEVTVEVLKNYLIENENIRTERIAVATGEQRELDAINLFDPACPIEFIITVEALKEGWDGSFAYVQQRLVAAVNPERRESVRASVHRHRINGRVQLELNLPVSLWTDLELSRWLDLECRQPDVTQPVLLEFCRKVVANLMETRGIPLSDLLRFKYPLAKAVQQKIKVCRRQVYARGYQTALFGSESHVETCFSNDFAFDRNSAYPAASFYQGAYQFKKHFP